MVEGTETEEGEREGREGKDEEEGEERRQQKEGSEERRKAGNEWKEEVEER